MEVKLIAEKANSIAKSFGAQKTMVRVSSTVAKEFNIESNKLTLLRTTFDQNLSLKTLIDGRQSLISGNQFSDDAIGAVARESVSTAKASPQDQGNGFAPNQGQRHFSFGEDPIDVDWIHLQLKNLLSEREQLFPKIIFEGGAIKFVKKDSVLATSEGTLLSSQQGYYEGSLMFTAKDGKQASSFNYITFGLSANDVGKSASFMEMANLRELLQQSSEQTKVQKVPAKFDGEVIITPHCMASFVGGWNEYLGSSMMLKGSSFFQDKLDQQVASAKLTLTAHPIESNFASRKFWTRDGYLAQNEAIFENGILKNYLLNHYAATKLGQKTSRSEGDYLKIAAGDTKLKDMISSVKKGVLMCRFSAGRPAENGDISGVAKNSYYIEDGEIKFPLGETMLAGNLARMLHDIKDVSQETISNGHWDFPWIRFTGITVS